MNLLWIVFANFIGDWGLQNHWVAENKGKSWMVMVGHCMVWTASICFVLNWLGLFALWKAVFLLVGHVAIDKFKCIRLEKTPASIAFDSERNTRRMKSWLYLDQFMHIVQCFVVWRF
jgi:hypothetical protein